MLYTATWAFSSAVATTGSVLNEKSLWGNIVVSIDFSMSSSKALICLSCRLPCYTLVSLYTPHMLTILSIICGRASARSSKSGGELRKLYMWCGRRPTTMMMMMKKRRERREYKVNSQFLIAQPSASFSVCLELEQHTALSCSSFGVHTTVLIGSVPESVSYWINLMYIQHRTVSGNTRGDDIWLT